MSNENEPRNRKNLSRILAASTISSDVLREVLRADEKHPPYNGPHEGWAVILEELDELWEHVRADTGRSDKARKEAIQVAATAMRYVLCVCDEVVK
ncbi:MAG: hypothetical protein ABJL72_12245 [Roseobacter sp.]